MSESKMGLSRDAIEAVCMKAFAPLLRHKLSQESVSDLEFESLLKEASQRISFVIAASASDLRSELSLARVRLNSASNIINEMILVMNSLRTEISETEAKLVDLSQGSAYRSQAKISIVDPMISQYSNIVAFKASQKPTEKKP
ncbi:MAG: hypothetical protein EOP06_01605 [Proteobacteria bacterium]|nr:MAG: hypothetical protein EOP06_01605 [Pseudomonadota bacterium]